MTIQIRGLAGLIVLMMGMTALGGSAEAGDLTLEDRLRAQSAIEQVYWSHRTWPKENRSPKPPFDAVMTREQVRAKVEDSLRKSNALAALWNRPVTATQLQAEMDRIATRTHDPLMLGELHKALGNDPRLIAETLVRQALVDRLIRAWFQGDERFQGSQRRKAEAALEACRNVACMPSMGGEYSQTRWRLDPQGTGGRPRPPREPIGHVAVPLDPAAWRDRLAGLARALDSKPESLPLRKLGGLEDTEGGFRVSAVLSQSRSELTTATVVWPKVAFDTWWQFERGAFAAALGPVPDEFTLATPVTAACADDTWTPAFFVPDPRRHALAVWTGTEIIVWGGDNGFDRLVSGGRYDPATDTWTPTSTGAGVPSGRASARAVWTGTELVVWGGCLGEGDNCADRTNMGGRYNPTTDTWKPTSVGINVPSGRSDHAAVWTGSRMIVWGGLGANGVLASGGQYDPSSDSWMPTSTGPNTPSARGGHTAVWTGTEMIIWAGSDQAGPANTGGRYDPMADAWTPTSTGANVPAARWYHTAVWTGSRMIVWGGCIGVQCLPDTTGGRYDPSSDTWMPTSTGSGVPSARLDHTAAWTGSRMIIWGGRDTNGDLNSGGRYDPSSDAWMPTSTGPNVPIARSSHLAISTGAELIVWGGESDFYGLFNSGARYDPSTDSWVPTMGWNVPSGRTGHVAVWTGAEMIIWGGEVPAGGRYDRATDTWLPMSAGSNAPPVRDNATAVWTGQEMIIWGGADAQPRALNSGGRYNPTTDVWFTTSMTGAPAPREYHTAVWTGARMIVWGGDDGFVTFNSGGRYDPKTDSWSATSTGANTPSGRELHTAVWTGAQMIVWGGGDDSGGRYDPSSDTWTPVSTGANTPSGRESHTAVWTGTEMIVWGGCCDRSTDPPIALRTGGRYEPSTDRWRPISSGLGVLAARSGHAALWTGVEMIVWGGWSGDMNSGAYQNTGGRYDPREDAWKPTSTGANVPQPLAGPTTVWTGTEMIVWGGIVGGNSSPNTAYRYCACTESTLYYFDADGDGYGDQGHPWPSCGIPVGPAYVPNDLDCNDSDPQVWLAPGEVSHLVVSPSEPTVVSWDDLGVLLGPSTTYQLVSGPSLLGEGFNPQPVECLQSTGGTQYADARPDPGVGTGYWYLARARNACGVGTYGTAQRDIAIAACP